MKDKFSDKESLPVAELTSAEVPTKTGNRWVKKNIKWLMFYMLLTVIIVKILQYYTYPFFVEHEYPDYIVPIVCLTLFLSLHYQYLKWRKNIRKSKKSRA